MRTVSANPRVNVSFANDRQSEWTWIAAAAEVVDDRGKAEQLWSPGWGGESGHLPADPAPRPAYVWLLSDREPRGERAEIGAREKVFWLLAWVLVALRRGGVR